MQLVDIFFLMGVTVLLIGAGLTSLRTDATVLTIEPAAALRKEPATVFDEADVVAPPSPPGGQGNLAASAQTTIRARARASD